MNHIDVSIVLNMHREALFLRPTLRSLDVCAIEAAKHGISVELVAVFDRADADTIEAFHSTQLSGFVGVKITEIDVGSLGLARNAGVELAEGDFVWTADGDDLVSSNAIVQLFQTAVNHTDKNAVVFIEYLIAFGEQYHICRHVGSTWLTAADFAFQHPYVSRIFLRRSIFKDLRYRDLKVTTGFAYEDWDFNCCLLAAGFTFLVAQGTVFFYRQRGNSLLRQANALSARIIPHSTLFEPAHFCSEMTRVRKEKKDWEGFLEERRNLHGRNFAEEIFASDELKRYVIEAAELDPEVEPLRIESAHSYCPVPWDGQHWGFTLETLYGLIGGTTFTDVVLLPWLRPGGAEKYILQILNQLRYSGVSRRILVISGENASKHEWVNLLPAGSVFVDLFNAFPALDDPSRDVLAVRAILAVTDERARLHLKASVFAHRLMNAFGSALATQLSVIYYRFCDDVYFLRNHQISSPWGVKFLREQLSHIYRLISDCRGIVERDTIILGGQVAKKYHVIYAHSDTKSDVLRSRTKPCRRLLWASRVSTQKRPELVGMIMTALHREMPDISVDVYGGIEQPYDREVFDAPGVRYHGAFSNFSELPIDKFDAFLYTSMFDGLPNIILEAMGAGLPAIAPDVGGIPEAVVDLQTGYLVPNHSNESALVDAYVQAIKKMYANWDLMPALRERAQELIKERHGKGAFAKRVSEVFHPIPTEGRR